MKLISIAGNPTLFHYKETHTTKAWFYKLFIKGERTLITKLHGIKRLKNIEKDQKLDQQEFIKTKCKLNFSKDAHSGSQGKYLRLFQFVSNKFYLIKKCCAIYDGVREPFLFQGNVPTLLAYYFCKQILTMK